MTTFETIILIALYLFAFSYMVHSFGIGDEQNNWVVRLAIIIAGATIGIIYFPAIFAEDIWKKLNEEQK